MIPQRFWVGTSVYTLRAWGPWWLNVQVLEHGLGTFYGIKIFGLALYVRWNLPKR